MGIDPAPFWANLYLHKFEYEFMLRLRSSDLIRARKFHGCSRFIDDQCCINDGGEFGRSYNEIYPADLELKCEHDGSHATFLDLDIRIEDGLFVYKLFDKRDAFPFQIVRMPDKGSNIPAYIFYGTILSEYLRIARCTLSFSDFIPKITALVQRMVRQGASIFKVIRQFHKAMTNHPEFFINFDMTPHDIAVSIKRSLFSKDGGS